MKWYRITLSIIFCAVFLLALFPSEKTFNNDATYDYSDKQKVNFRVVDSLNRAFVKIPNTWSSNAVLPDSYNDYLTDYLKLYKFDSIRISGRTFKNKAFYSSSFSQCTFIRDTFLDCYFDNGELQNCIFDSVYFEFCRFQNDFFKDDFLDHVIFDRTDLKNTNWDNCRFRDVIFEPDSLPEAVAISRAQGLDRLFYIRNPSPLIQLMHALDAAGFRGAAKQVNASIKRSDNLKNNYFVYYLKIIFLDLPYEYGADSTRPLKIYLLLFLFFSCIYWIFNGVDKKSFIQKIKMIRVGDKEIPLQVNMDFRPGVSQKQIKELFSFEGRILLLSLKYSLSRSLRLGFGLFDFSKWIKMFQIEKYDFDETNYLRPVAGFQSLISLYLIFLWIVSTFEVG